MKSALIGVQCFYLEVWNCSNAISETFIFPFYAIESTQFPFTFCLTDNDIGPEGANFLAGAFAKNTALKSIKLDGALF